MSDSVHDAVRQVVRDYLKRLEIPDDEYDEERFCLADGFANLVDVVRRQPRLEYPLHFICGKYLIGVNQNGSASIDICEVVSREP